MLTGLYLGLNIDLKGKQSKTQYEAFRRKENKDNYIDFCIRVIFFVLCKIMCLIFTLSQEKGHTDQPYLVLTL